MGGKIPQRGRQKRDKSVFFGSGLQKGEVDHLDKLDWGGFMACKININPCVYKGTMWFPHFRRAFPDDSGRFCKQRIAR